MNVETLANGWNHVRVDVTHIFRKAAATQGWSVESIQWVLHGGPKIWSGSSKVKPEILKDGIKKISIIWMELSIQVWVKSCNTCPWPYYHIFLTKVPYN